MVSIGFPVSSSSGMSDILGKETEDGEYTGLHAMSLLYQYCNAVLDILAAPGWCVVHALGHVSDREGVQNDLRALDFHAVVHGEIGDSKVTEVRQGSVICAYIGTAPVNLVRGYAEAGIIPRFRLRAAQCRRS